MDMPDKSEEEERLRQEQERSRLAFRDRFYDAPPATSIDGGPDLRSAQRTGRVFQLNVRMGPHLRAIVTAIVLRDRPPSLAVLFEDMVQAYLEKRGALAKSLIPSDEELVRRYEKEKDIRDAE